jgi:hypothetical protein
MYLSPVKYIMQSEATTGVKAMELQELEFDFVVDCGRRVRLLLLLLLLLLEDSFLLTRLPQISFWQSHWCSHMQALSVSIPIPIPIGKFTIVGCARILGKQIIASLCADRPNQ